MARHRSWAMPAAVFVLGVAVAVQGAAAGLLRPAARELGTATPPGGVWRRGVDGGIPRRPALLVANATLPTTFRWIKPRPFRSVPAVKRPIIYYTFLIDVTSPPGGFVSTFFDDAFKGLTAGWFQRHGIVVNSMYLEHVVPASSVISRGTITYYLSMVETLPDVTVSFSEYCGYNGKLGEVPGVVKDIRRMPNMGRDVLISMATSMRHETRLQSGGRFDEQTGQLIVPKPKKKLSARSLIIIIVSCVVGSVVSVAVGLMLYFRVQAESAARYSPFTWMADRRRRSSAASSYQGRDSYTVDGDDYEGGRSAPSFSLSPLDRPERGCVPSREVGGAGGEPRGELDDERSYDSEEDEVGQGGDRRATSSSFCDSQPGSLPYLSPPGSG